jgi:hypothetical protein
MRALLAVALTLAGCGGSPKKEAAAPAPAPREPRVEREADQEIQLQGELGTLDQEQVEGPFRNVSAEVSACYHSAVGKLWYLGGKLELKVRVNKDGSVKQVTTLTPLGSFAVESCIVTIARGLFFPHPKGNAEAEFNYSWDFRAKASLKEWSNDDVGEKFDKHRPELVTCEKKGPVPPGLRVTFYVTPGGKVTSVGLGADAPLDEGYARCVAERVAAWKFDDPLGKIARATYQF